jgi:hypothetical protein
LLISDSGHGLFLLAFDLRFARYVPLEHSITLERLIS